MQPAAAPELTVPCRCVPVVTPFVHKKVAWAGVVLPVLVAMLVAMLMAYHVLRTLRPGLQQDALAQAAAKKANSITLVLVDIEGTDELCRWNQMVSISRNQRPAGKDIISSAYIAQGLHLIDRACGHSHAVSTACCSGSACHAGSHCCCCALQRLHSQRKTSSAPTAQLSLWLPCRHWSLPLPCTTRLCGAFWESTGVPRSTLRLMPCC